jgi:uncharacterized membrane protein
MGIAEEILTTLGDLPWWGKWLSTVGIAMLPIVELRGALPAAVKVFGMSWGLSFLLSIFGNLFPIPFLLRFFPAVEKFLRRWKPFELFFEWLFKRTRRKGERKVKLWGEMGLILFVAIPLPVTGAWTGTLVSYLLDLNKFKSFMAITLGVLIAGLIVTVITYSSIWWGILIITVLIMILVVLERLEERLLEKKENTSG